MENAQIYLQCTELSTYLTYRRRVMLVKFGTRASVSHNKHLNHLGLGDVTVTTFLQKVRNLQQS
jgi:hypothetical protein